MRNHRSRPKTKKRKIPPDAPSAKFAAPAPSHPDYPAYLQRYSWVSFARNRHLEKGRLAQRKSAPPAFLDLTVLHLFHADIQSAADIDLLRSYMKNHGLLGKPDQRRWEDARPLRLPRRFEFIDAMLVVHENDPQSLYVGLQVQAIQILREFLASQGTCDPVDRSATNFLQNVLPPAFMDSLTPIEKLDLRDLQVGLVLDAADGLADWFDGIVAAALQPRFAQFPSSSRGAAIRAFRLELAHDNTRTGPASASHPLFGAARQVDPEFRWSRRPGWISMTSHVTKNHSRTTYDKIKIPIIRQESKYQKTKIAKSGLARTWSRGDRAIFPALVQALATSSVEFWSLVTARAATPVIDLRQFDLDQILACFRPYNRRMVVEVLEGIVDAGEPTSGVTVTKRNIMYKLAAMGVLRPAKRGVYALDTLGFLQRAAPGSGPV